MERALIDQYEDRIGALLPALTTSNLALAVRIADVPDRIRGYSHVKEANAKQAQEEWKRLQAEWQAFSAPLARAA